mmetsp:Transcript_23061/g.63687  ORF Transcript_23061/g.63687 Transcript_23061/m.63687 type:complete len:200 (+) Transcript_23061:911-1510(+)
MEAQMEISLIRLTTRTTAAMRRSKQPRVTRPLGKQQMAVLLPSSLLGQEMSRAHGRCPVLPPRCPSSLSLPAATRPQALQRAHQELALLLLEQLSAQHERCREVHGTCVWRLRRQAPPPQTPKVGSPQSGTTPTAPCAPRPAALPPLCLLRPCPQPHSKPPPPSIRMSTWWVAQLRCMDSSINRTSREQHNRAKHLTRI